MKVADRGVEGIGFAIPIDQAVPVLNALMEKGKVSRPYLGVYTMNLGYYLDGIEMNGLDDPDEEEGSEDTGELREETDGEAFEPAEPVAHATRDIIAPTDTSAPKPTRLIASRRSPRPGCTR